MRFLSMGLSPVIFSVFLVFVLGCDSDPSNGETGSEQGGDEDASGAETGSEQGGDEDVVSTEGGEDAASEDISETTCESAMITNIHTPIDVCDLETCNEVQDVLNSLHADNIACATDEECTVTTGSLDYTCDCGAVMNVQAVDDVAELQNRWTELGCDPDCGPGGIDCAFCDCVPPNAALCEENQCSPSFE